MKFLFGLLGLLTLTIQHSVFADALPPSVTQALRVREQHLDKLAFDWTLETRQVAPQKTPDRVLSLQRATEKQLPGILRRKGITNDATIQKIVAEQVREVPNMLKGFSSVSSGHLRFARDGGETLVVGTKQQGTYLAEYSQFYENRSSLIVNKINKITAVGKNSLDTPKVYGCQGDSTRYYVPTLRGLDILPEHFVMLDGLNPLALYGASWQSAGSTSSSWILVSQIKQPHQLLTTIKLTLDKGHDNAPSAIEVHRGNTSVVSRTLQYKPYKGTWISSEVNLAINLVGVLNTNQNWTLRTVSPVSSVSANLMVGTDVIDYRLLGPSPNLFATSPSQADSLRKNVVIYSWTGQFLDLNQLEQMHEKQHPGESTPDLGQSGSTSKGALVAASNALGSAMPFVGGVLCVGGGVWMFKQRRAN